MKTKTPIPQGKYLPAIRNLNLIYTSGMTPRKSGKLIYSGKIKFTDSIEIHKEAVVLATTNAINAAKSCLEEGERISKVLQLNVFLNTDPEFTSHARIADFASEVLLVEFGSQCIGSRAAIGVNSLPSNAPVEITLTVKVEE